MAARASRSRRAEGYDPEGLVDAMFSGSKSGLRPIYDQILKLGLEQGDDVKACPCQTILPLYWRHVFAQIKPRTHTEIDLGFALRDRPVKPKSGSSTTADRAKSLKGFRISTASQFTLRVITDSVTIACGLTTYLILGGANCRI